MVDLPQLGATVLTGMGVALIPVALANKARREAEISRDAQVDARIKHLEDVEQHHDSRIRTLEMGKTR